MKKKSVLLAALSVMMVAAIATATTLAYFTDAKTATNTFTVGNVAITLTENDAWTLNATTGKYENADAKLIPGRVIDKEPTVAVVAGSEESYVRVEITVNKVAEWETAFAGLNVTLKDLFAGKNDNWDWATATETADAEANTVTFTVNYNAKVNALAAEQDVSLGAVFTDIQVPNAINDVSALEGFEVTVIAQAIQAEGFENAAAAWAAFNA